MGIISVLGIIARQELLSRSPGSPEVRERASRFGELLERRGFRCTVRHWPVSSLVDFLDPEFNRMLIREAALYDMEKVSAFSWSLFGTMEFLEAPGSVKVYGDIPVALVRKPTAKGFLGERIEIPPDLSVFQIHWHVEDTLPATHIHVEGVDVNLEGLARFIGELRDISKRFLVEKGL